VISGARTVFPHIEDHNFYIDHWSHTILWNETVLWLRKS
jgi:hypothetical protein